MTKSNSQETELQEGITQLIEQELAKHDIPEIKDFPFQIIVAADANNKVKAMVRWPDDVPMPTTAEIVSSLLFHLTEGNWNPPLMQSVDELGKEKGCHATSMSILKAWADKCEAIKQSQGNKYVKPSEVFIRRG